MATERPSMRGGSDVIPMAASVFAHAQVAPQVIAVRRGDGFDPDTHASHAGYREFMVLAGLDWSPQAAVHVQPNLMWRGYDAKDNALADREADIVARITLQYSYR